MRGKSQLGLAIYQCEHIQMMEVSESTRDALVRRGLRFAHLRLMAALREAGQVSAAAAQLSITQPAASRLMAELERATGVQLYRRHPRGVTLTDAGRLFAERAAAVLRQLDDAQDEIGQLAQGARGVARIGSVTGPALEIVLPAIRALRQSHPDVELEVQVDTSDRLGEALLKGEIDFYLGRLTEGIDPRAVEVEPVGPEPLSLVVRADHPLTRVARPTLGDCLSFDWVMQGRGGLLRRTAEAYLLERGLPPPARVLSTASLLLTLAIVRETSAIAPLARSVATYHAAGGGRVALLDVATDMAVAPFSLVLRRAEPLTPAAQRACDLVRAEMPPPSAA